MTARQPLGELPLSQFARPASPIKTVSSPAKMTLAASPTKRQSQSSTSSPTSSGPFTGQPTPARRRLFEEAPADPRSLETSPVIQRKKSSPSFKGRRNSSATSSNGKSGSKVLKSTKSHVISAHEEGEGKKDGWEKSASCSAQVTPESRPSSHRTSRSPSPSLVRSERRKKATEARDLCPSTPSTSAPERSEAVSVPASLPRKKERVKSHEGVRGLVDQGENIFDECSPPGEEEEYVRAGSPSPFKQAGTRKGNRHTSTSSSVSIGKMLSNDPDAIVSRDLDLGSNMTSDLAYDKTAANIGANGELGKPSGGWAVYQDSSEDGEGIVSHIHLTATLSEPIDDKENLRPEGMIATARKKGTGGRLSLLDLEEEEAAKQKPGVEKADGSLQC